MSCSRYLSIEFAKTYLCNHDEKDQFIQLKMHDQILVVKLSCFLLLFCFISPNMKAQNDWKEGYVVTNKGDTLRGSVRDRDTGSFGGLLGKILIKEGRKRAKRFKANKIQAYSWGGAKFVTLYTERKSEFLKSKIFVTGDGGEPDFYRVISEGPLSLYHHEFTDPDNAVIDFIPYFKREGNPQLVLATQGLFGLKKKLLSDFFADKPDLVEKIRNGTLKTPSDVLSAY